jgi:hypothetical protein
MNLKIEQKIFLSSFLLLASCSKLDPCVEKEVSRLKSPDQKVEAVVQERDCGATTSAVSKVFIVKTGDEIEKDPVFEADKIDGLEIKWKESKQLRVEYLNARIFNYKNFWLSKKVDNYEYEVSVLEKSKNQEW